MSRLRPVPTGPANPTFARLRIQTINMTGISAPEKLSVAIIAWTSPYNWIKEFRRKVINRLFRLHFA